jgi:hypothetical protein
LGFVADATFQCFHQIDDVLAFWSKFHTNLLAVTLGIDEFGQRGLVVILEFFRFELARLENRGKRVAMTETLTYVAIYLLIGWLIQQVEDAIASTEDKAGLEETARRMMYGEPTLWDRFVGKLYLLKYIVGWPYYLLRRLILIGL